MELLQVMLCIGLIICVSTEANFARKPSDMQRSEAELLDEMLKTVISSRNTEADNPDGDLENMIEEHEVSIDSSKHLQKLIRTK